jgi:chitinase
LFDGFNIDWEFPTATDINNFTALLTEFRNEMTALTATTGKTYQLTADLAAGVSNAQNPGGYDTVKPSAVAAQLDFMTVDGYIYAGDWSNATNDASPLYDETANPLYGTGLTIDATVQFYLSHGTPAAKYTVGFPLYGAGWAGGLTSANSGMYQNATGIKDPTGALTPNGTSPVPNANGVGNCSSGQNQSSPAPGCDFLLTDGLATYGTLVNLLNSGFTPTYDATRCAACMFNPSTNVAFSYDNAASVQYKARPTSKHTAWAAHSLALRDGCGF